MGHSTRTFSNNSLVMIIFSKPTRKQTTPTSSIFSILTTQYLDLTNSALLVSPRYKYSVPVNILMTFTFSFFFTLGTLLVLINLLGLEAGGSSGISSPPLALVDLVLMLPARLAGFFLSAFFFFAAATAARLPSENVTLRNLRLVLSDSSLLRLLLLSDCSSEEPVPVPEPRVLLLVIGACAASSRLSSL
jgi:hypothetical protein